MLIIYEGCAEFIWAINLIKLFGSVNIGLIKGPFRVDEGFGITVVVEYSP